MAKDRSRRGVGLEPLLHLGIARAIDQQAGGAQPGQRLQVGTDAAIGRNVVERLDGGLGIVARLRGGGAESRQHPVAAGRRGRELGKGRLRLGVLVLFGKLDCLVEGITRLSRLLGLQILIAAPAADRSDDQKGRGDNVDRILVPQLLKLLATYFLVDFVK